MPDAADIQHQSSRPNFIRKL